VSSAFRFGELVAELEETLTHAIDLVPVSLDPDLARAQGTWRGTPAVIETRVYRGSCLRYVRFVQMSGDGLEIGNVLCLADPVTPHPIFGADLVAVGRETGMIAADLSPTLPPGPARQAQLGPLAAAHERRPALPSGGELPGWCIDWFSPYFLYTRVPPEQAADAANAFRDMVNAFVQIVRSTAPSVEHLTAVAAAQDGYAEAHRTDDKGLRMLANIFGAAWAERYLHTVLFPPLDPHLLGWEIALACDAEGRVTWADDRASVLLDARPGRPFQDCVLPTQSDKVQHFLEAARASAADAWELAVMVCGRPTTLLFRGVARAGGALLVGSLQPELHREAGARVAGIASELATLHREAERQRRELAQTQEGLREALERERAAREEAEALAAERAAVLGQLAEGVIITGADGRISFANEAAVRLHGAIELDVPIARYAETYHVLTLDGQPYPPEALPLAQAVERGETTVGAEWRVRRPDGSEVIVQGSAAPVIGEDGTRLGAVLVLRGVTAQRMLEWEKDELLATISHDLKNPLTALEMLAETLRDGAQRGVPLAPDSIARMTRQMEVSASRMVGMLDELLDLARLRMTRPSELRRRPTDLVTLTREVVAERQRDTSQHRLCVDVQVDAVVGNWDPSRLARVLANLLDNAIKFSPDGGDITLRISQSESAGDGSAVVEVIDRGIGIPSADLGRVFERFHRGSNVVGRVGGTGVGLAGVRDIVEQHGGTVTLASQEGMGTTVSVRLPLAPGAGERG
jgi:phycocyanobilin:ferredoxin oxidoreductase